MYARTRSWYATRSERATFLDDLDFGAADEEEEGVDDLPPPSDVPAPPAAPVRSPPAPASEDEPEPAGDRSRRRCLAEEAEG